ncbi:MAG TPA: ATP-binding cassette domain-containing protein [Gemmatimonadaceae bacterium]|nr:ATP-binding cassette domain-containing protein [Gemmatimonadaceae bacterium]
MRHLVLSLSAVSKHYRAGVRGCSASVAVLRNLDLQVRSGEIVGVSGGQGMGKTTLLLCAAGLLRADSGTLRWLGGSRVMAPTGAGRLAVHAGTAGPRARTDTPPPNGAGGIAYVAVLPSYYPFLTVREVLETYSDTCFQRVAAAERARTIRASIEATSLGAHLNTRVGNLPDPVRKQLGLAVALAGRPWLLLLDDMLATAQQPGISQAVGAVLRERSQRGAAVIIASRERAPLEGVATRQLRLVAGALFPDPEAAALAETTRRRRKGARATDGVPHRAPASAARVAERARPAARALPQKTLGGTYHVAVTLGACGVEDALDDGAELPFSPIVAGGHLGAPRLPIDGSVQ